MHPTDKLAKIQAVTSQIADRPARPQPPPAVVPPPEATPLVAPAPLASPPPPGPCLGLALAPPPTSQIFGAAVAGRLRTIRLSRGMAPTVAWTIVDSQNCPLDLTPCVVGGIVPVVFRFRETTWAAAADQTFGTAASVLNAASGLVQVVLDPIAVGGPGIFAAEFDVLAGDLSTVIISNPFLLLLERNLFDGQVTGPPTVAEIRLHMRDSGQAESLLLGAVEFDDAEIAAAIQRPVDYWNGELPFLDQVFTTQSFPPRYRYWWLEGIAASLYRMAAVFYRRNRLDYQAGGLAVQDLNKADDYEQVAVRTWEKFTGWVRSAKIAENASQGWGEVRSGYSNYGLYGSW